jgi:hypothetical protein
MLFTLEMSIGPAVAPRASGGVTQDHTAVNPFGPDGPSLDPEAFPPVLIVSARSDRVLRYAMRLKEMGKQRSSSRRRSSRSFPASRGMRRPTSSS